MNKNQKIGKFGENLAVEYLLGNNYVILDRNFRCKQGEIDIIAKDKSEVVFIEVKTRSNFSYGKPIEAIDEKKMKHIKESAIFYIYSKKMKNTFVRFDAIEICLQHKRAKLYHTKRII